MLPCAGSSSARHCAAVVVEVEQAVAEPPQDDGARDRAQEDEEEVVAAQVPGALALLFGRLLLADRQVVAGRPAGEEGQGDDPEPARRRRSPASPSGRRGRRGAGTGRSRRRPPRGRPGSSPVAQRPVDHAPGRHRRLDADPVRAARPGVPRDARSGRPRGSPGRCGRRPPGSPASSSPRAAAPAAVQAWSASATDRRGIVPQRRPHAVERGAGDHRPVAREGGRDRRPRGGARTGGGAPARSVAEAGAVGRPGPGEELRLDDGRRRPRRPGGRRGRRRGASRARSGGPCPAARGRRVVGVEDGGDRGVADGVGRRGPAGRRRAADPLREGRRDRGRARPRAARRRTGSRSQAVRVVRAPSAFSFTWERRTRSRTAVREERGEVGWARDRVVRAAARSERGPGRSDTARGIAPGGQGLAPGRQLGLDARRSSRRRRRRRS